MGHLEDGLNLLVRPSSGGGGGVSGTFSYLQYCHVILDQVYNEAQIARLF